MKGRWSAAEDICRLERPLSCSRNKHILTEILSIDPISDLRGAASAA
jgi:hypothetical protein